jgi:quercetin dioxygenase-like cupin family protein
MPQVPQQSQFAVSLIGRPASGLRGGIAARSTSPKGIEIRRVPRGLTGVVCSPREDAMKKPGSKMPFAIGLLVGAVGMSVLGAQQTPSPKVTLLLKKDMQIPGREAVMGLAELPPGAAEGRHTHPGDAFVYVLEGSLTYEEEGKPAATHKAGDAFVIESGKIHDQKNLGTTPEKHVAFLIAEKGKPLRTDAQ